MGNGIDLSELWARGITESGFSGIPTCVYFSPQDFNLMSELNDKFIDYHMSPEELVSRKEFLSKMSGEAREVLRLIILTPAEIVEEITSANGSITKSKLIKYLRRQLSKRFRCLKREYPLRRGYPSPTAVIERSFEEIRAYLREGGRARINTNSLLLHRPPFSWNTLLERKGDFHNAH